MKISKSIYKVVILTLNLCDQSKLSFELRLIQIVNRTKNTRM
jgi:hypothetical protein